MQHILVIYDHMRVINAGIECSFEDSPRQTNLKGEIANCRNLIPADPGSGNLVSTPGPPKTYKTPPAVPKGHPSLAPLRKYERKPYRWQEDPK